VAASRRRDRSAATPLGKALVMRDAVVLRVAPHGLAQLVLAALRKKVASGFCDLAKKSRHSRAICG